MRFFNTAGPVVPQDHYCVDPLARVDLDEVLQLIGQKKCFVLHAPRQTGKTSTLLALVDRLNRESQYRCLYVNFEVGQAARDDTARAMRALLGQLASRSIQVLGDRFVDREMDAMLARHGPDGALSETLSSWCAACSQPLVLLVDEIDSLVGDTLISVLRQLRSNYDRRPTHFPQSVILCGVRDVRDYRIYSSRERAVITGASAFNIKAESLRLGDFSESEVAALIASHTAESGQAFQQEAIHGIWSLTLGQPWLVNALAYQACFKNPSGRDRSRAICPADIERAKEALIQARATHLDQLADKLNESRVRGVVEPLLAGTGLPADLPADDLDYVVDLGLVRADPEVEIANPIYREVVPRQLIYSAERFIAHPTAWYVDTAGRLDLPKLLAAFQSFYRENADSWAERFSYREAGPQLLLQAFLQRIVNGGGRLEREYALGRGRTDLLIRWPTGRSGDPPEETRHVIECKVARSGRGPATAVRDGLEQTADYMDRCGAESGHLVVFDGREGRSWEERLYRKDEIAAGRAITVWGV